MKTTFKHTLILECFTKIGNVNFARFVRADLNSLTHPAKHIREFPRQRQRLRHAEGEQ